jgi:uncharacterized protein
VPTPTIKTLCVLPCRDRCRRALDAMCGVQAGRTALLIAAGEGQTQCVTALALDLATRVERLTARTKAGNTALHRAAAYGGANVIRAVVGLFASAKSALAAVDLVNAVNDEGRTPLMRAARWGREAEVQALLKAGADTSTVDKEGLSAREWAERKGFASVLARLDSVASAGGGVASLPPSVDTYIAECSAYAADVARQVKERLSGVAVGGDDDGDDDDAAAAATSEDIRLRGRTLSVVAGHAGVGLLGPQKVEGWMAKKGHLFRSWRNRWFVLDKATMLYFARPDDKKAKGEILLSKSSTVEPVADYHRSCVFCINTATKPFLVQAADEEEMRDWIASIKAHIASIQ